MNIHQFVAQQIQDYITKEITVVDGYEFNQSDLMKRIELYTNSRYEHSQFDTLGKRKPFFNILTRILNKQRTAEELDTKDIQLMTTRPQHYAKSFIMTLCNRQWMKKSNFAHTLNNMTETRGKYGGLLVKRVRDNDGMVDIEVVDWHNVITDPVDIAGGVKIERHFYTPAQLIAMKERGWGKGDFDGSIERAIEYLAQADQEKDEEAEERETMGDYVPVFEVHGVLPEKMINEDAEENSYTRQMHIIVAIDEFEGVLFQENDVEDVYKYLPYRKTSRRSLGIGMVEESMEAQIWTNDAKIKEKQAMDFAGKVLLQSADGKFKNKNIFKHIKNGTILEHAQNKPITGMNVTPGGLVQFGNMVGEWDRQVSNATSVQQSNTGGDLPSATPFRALAIQNQEANSIFQLRQEEMGIFLQEIYRDWILPELKSYLKNQEYITSKLSPDELEILQKDYVQKMSDRKVIQNIFEGQYDQYPPETKWLFIQQDRQNIKNLVSQEIQGARFFKVPDDYLDEIEYELDIVITNEQRIKQVYLETLTNILQTVAGNPTLLENPRTKKIFDQIMETAGISPMEFEGIETPAISERDAQEINNADQGQIEAPQVAEEETNVV